MEAVAGGVALMWGRLTDFQRDIIYHPSRSLPAIARTCIPEMVEKTVRTEDGLDLVGWYAAADSDAPCYTGKTVILFHGNGGSLADRAHKARFWLDHGYGVWLVGYRGYGGNPGHPSEAGLFRDARAVIEAMLAAGCTEQDLVLYGESLGTGIAIRMGADYHGFAAILLESPYLSLPSLMSVPTMPGLNWFMTDRYDNAVTIRDVQDPLLIMHGAQDGIVPVSHGIRLFDLALMPTKEKAILTSASHTDLWECGGQQAALDFMNTLLHGR
jgi:uncharacterized protein